MKVLFHWRGSRLELGHTPETCHDVELQQSNKPPHVLFVTVSFLTPHCSCCCVTCWRPLHHRGLWLRCQRFKWQIFMCSVRMFSSPGCLVEPVCVLWDGVTESWTSVAPSKDKNTAHMPNWGQVAGPSWTIYLHTLSSPASLQTAAIYLHHFLHQSGNVQYGLFKTMSSVRQHHAVSEKDQRLDQKKAK